MPTSRADREAGFTLLELLAVLVIMGLATGAVLQAGRSSAETAAVRSFLIRAEAMMRDARTAAIETMTEQDVVIDKDAKNLVHTGWGSPIKVPQGVSLTGELAGGSDSRTKGHVIRFFPGGGSTGATLAFRFRGEVYRLRVNWLTGHADVRRG